MEDYFSPKTIGEVDITNEEYALEIIPNDHDNYYPYGPDAIQAAFNLRKPLSPAFSPNLVHNRDAAISTRDRISRSSTLGDEGSMLSGSPCNYHDAWPQRNPGLQIPDIPKFDEAASSEQLWLVPKLPFPGKYGGVWKQPTKP
ncbi:hypothetical protein AX16_006417 [Volvariella volvacea WC 439]|nr:hypothetical protein AX16_006417 [Volvariella volvacea WC 439]